MYSVIIWNPRFSNPMLLQHKPFCMERTITYSAYTHVIERWCSVTASPWACTISLTSSVILRQLLCGLFRLTYHLSNPFLTESWQHIVLCGDALCFISIKAWHNCDLNNASQREIAPVSTVRTVSRPTARLYPQQKLFRIVGLSIKHI